MAYDGSIKFDTGINTSGFEKDGKKLTDIAKGVGLFKIFETGFKVIASSVDAATARYDTLQRFPRVLEQMGFGADEAKAATQRLSEGIQGLPTTLDSVVSTAQRLTVLTGNLNLATETTLALNNAFLASGSSAADAERGLNQYVQMLSSGKVDMQSWRTLQETMGLALNKVAEAFGFAGASAQNDLYAALRDGDITFAQFNQKIVELNDGMGGFAEMAKTSSGGIQTAMTNIKTAITSGVTNVIGKIDGLLEKFGGIEGVMNSAKEWIKAGFEVINEAVAFAAENIVPLTGAVIGLGVAVKAVQFLSMVGQMGSVTKAVISMLPQIVLLTAAKLKDIAVTGTLHAMYLKDAVVKAASAASQKILTASIWLYQAATTSGTITTAAYTVAVKIAAVATKAFDLAMRSLPLLALVAGIAAVVGVFAALAIQIAKGSTAYQTEKQNIESSTEAHKEYTEELEKAHGAAAAAMQEKRAEIETNRSAVKSLQELIAKHRESDDQNHAIAASVNQLNSSMEGLGLTYNSTTGQLNMSNEELNAYIDNLAAVTEHQMAQEEYTRLLTEQQTVQQKINDAKAKEAEWNADANLSEHEKGELIKQNDAYINEMLHTVYGLNTAVAEQKKVVEDTANAEAEAAVKRVQIMNNQMGQVKEYADLWGMSAEEVIDAASQMAGGLEELAAQQSKLFTSTGQDVGMISEIYKQSEEDINAWVESTGGSLDDYVKWAKENLTENGENVADLATKWGTSTTAIERAMVANGQTAQQWEEAQIAALDAVREYAIQAGESYEDIEAAATAAGMGVDAYVASQKSALTESGMDIQQVADYWGVSVDVIENHMDRWKVSLDQAHNDMAAMRTEEGLTLDQLAEKYKMTSDEIKDAAADQNTTWQEWGNSMDETVNKLSETYGIAAKQIIAESQAMAGGLEEWATKAEQEHQRAQVAEQDYVEQIKAGNIEINEVYAQSLEARRVNGEQLNAIEQATLEQWKAMNQAAVDAYKAQQQEIIDASKAKASEIKVSEQQSAADILAIQASNNAATADFVQNYNTIWAQIPPEQRGVLSELDIDSALMLQQLASTWEEGGREQWEQYVAGIKESEATAAQLNSDVAEKVTQAGQDVLEGKEGEYKQAGTDLADATGAGMEASTAPSEASQAIADAVIEDLTNADYSAITGGIAAAITAGTSEVTAAAKSMADGVLSEVETMKTDGKTKAAEMMTNINSEIVTKAATVKASATSMGNGVVTEMTSMQTRSVTIVTQMMTGMNTTVITYSATIKASVTSMANGVVTEITSMQTRSVTITTQMMTGMNSVVITYSATIKASITSMANGVVTEVTSMQTRSVSITTQMMTGMNSVVITYSATMRASATSTANGVVSGFQPMVSGSANVMNQAMNGMYSILSSRGADLVSKARDIASQVAAAMAGALEVKSPSRVMIRLFGHVMDGAFIGLDNGEDMLFGKAWEIADGLADILTISPEVAASLTSRMQAIVETTPISPATYDRLSSPLENSGNVVNYYFQLTQNNTSPVPLSERELTEAAEDMFKRAKWQLP